MSEKDLDLKVASRALLWRMGFSTRLDVVLRAYVPAGRGRSDEDFTDLDVLGVAIAPGFHVQTAIADCKTSPRRSTERMFWLRGVGDLFDSDHAYMVRSNTVTAAARQLAARLRISVLTEADLHVLSASHEDDLGLDLAGENFAFLFSRAAVERELRAFDGLDAQLKPLLDYRGFDYWMDQPWRAINQLVAHMRSVPRLLDPTNPLHLALFFDLTWLYTLSLAHAVEHIRATAVADVETTLSRYVVGGELAWRERKQMSELLRAATPSEALIDVPDDGVLPPWHSMLLEIVGRMQRVPSVAGPMLRYAEWMTAALCARKRTTIGQAFGATADPRAAKMLTDVAGFLAAATGLHPGFRSMARDLVVTDLAGGTPTFSVATGERGRDTA